MNESNIRGKRAPITPREIDILRLIVKGYSNQQIAVELDCARETVKTHIRHILSKLNAAGRTHAVIIAKTQGMLEDDLGAPMPESRDLTTP